MIKACQASAKRLGKNVDLVQMHWSTANYAPRETTIIDLDQYSPPDLVVEVASSS